MTELLDNLIWGTLTGPLAGFAVGAGGARRFAVGLPPIAGFENPDQPDLGSLAAVTQPGERIYTRGWSGPAGEPWTVEEETSMLTMVWSGSADSLKDSVEAVRLGAADTGAAAELIGISNPGPFGPRVFELGDYFGVFDGPRLVSMAGERFWVGDMREVSAVCTHPDYQGRGLARRLVTKIVQCQLERGQTPFLHVLSENQVARRVYERIGFKNHSEPIMRVVRFDG